jgi:hypothetical protein
MQTEFTYSSEYRLSLIVYSADNQDRTAQTKQSG